MSLLLLTSLLLGADAFQVTFDQANDAYLRGDFAAAAEGYEALISENIEDASVFFNLGNAYFRLSRLGLAIANYERALRLEPGFDDAHENLALAVMRTRQKTGKALPEPWAQNLLFWHYGVARDTTRLLALVLWVTFWALLMVRQWRAFPYWRGAAAAAAVLAAAFAGSAWAKAHPAPMAVVIADDTALRYGPSESEQVVAFTPEGSADKTAATLFDGDRATVEARANGWARIATVDGKRGWAPESALVFVDPPYRAPQDTAATGANANEEKPA